jgi:hypothetical protein
VSEKELGSGFATLASIVFACGYQNMLHTLNIYNEKKN